MYTNDKSLFRKVCADYLNALSLTDLHAYGRYLQITSPTKTRKAELIDEIISVLCGESKPTRNNRGAPVKQAVIRQDVINDIAKICERYGVSNGVSCGVEEVKAETVKAVDAPPAPISSTLNLTIHLELLDEKQKELLTDFLNSTM